MADKPSKGVTNLNIEQQKKLTKLAEEHLGVILDWNKAMTDYNDKGYKALDEIRERLRIQKAIKKDTKAYFEYLKDIKDIDKEIGAIEAKVRQLRLQGIKESAEEIQYLKRKQKELQEQRDLIKDQISQTNKLKVAWAGVQKGGKKVEDTYNAIDRFLSGNILGGMFKMLKVLKTTTAEMGVVGERSKVIQRNIRLAAKDTTSFGLGMEEIAKIQSSYSDELGTTQALSKDALKDLGMIGKVTGLGSDAVGRMAGQMGGFGYSAERSVKFVGQVMKDTTAMGLNTAKVLKNIQGNIRLLNRYNFKNGIKGLAKMAEKTTKMGVSLNFAAAMADKLFDIEGAVEMSAQLQVMGGEWAKLADPFKLMYMARNDMEGLTTAVINATKASAKFNAKTGEFDISALKMHELRKVAEMTGLNFEELAQSAKNAAKYAAIDKQMKFNFDDTTKEFIENTAALDEKGRAKIIIDGAPKYLDALTEADKTAIERMSAEKKNLKDRALEVTTFDDQFRSLVERLKILLLPILDKINDVVVPKFEKFLQTISSDEVAGKIEEFVKQVPVWFEKVKEIGKSIWGFVQGVAKFAAKFPKMTVAAIGGLALAIGGLKWFAYGRILGAGFNSVARAGGMGGGRGVPPGGFAAGRRMVKFNRFMTGFGGIAAGGLLSGGLDALDAESTAEGIGNVAGGVLGAALGSFFGPWGTMIGGMLGSKIGGAIGDTINKRNQPYRSNNPDVAYSPASTSMNDGVIKFNKNDKFMKVNDSTMIAGTNANGNKELAKTIMSNLAPKAPGINSLMRSNTVANVPSKLDVKHDNLKVDGVIRLELDGYTKGIDSDKLLNNKLFLRDLNLAMNKIQTEQLGKNS